jgi:hypothetical protein
VSEAVSRLAVSEISQPMDQLLADCLAAISAGASLDIPSRQRSFLNFLSVQFPPAGETTLSLYLAKIAQILGISVNELLSYINGSAIAPYPISCIIDDLKSVLEKKNAVYAATKINIASGLLRI